MIRLHTPQEACQWLQEISLSAAGSKGIPLKGELRSDSRSVHAGDVFLAWPGKSHDPRAFVGDVLANGAVACLVHEELDPEVHEHPRLTWLDDPRVALYPNLKAQRGFLASAYYGEPSQSLKVSAVTGTNGKTTCTWWLTQALTQLGSHCAIAGTLGQGRLDASTHGIESMGSRSSGLTTMEAVELQAQMRRWVDQGVTHLNIEASSIGLQESRMDGTRIEVAIFTNFTQDHLDYHGDMANYWQAKTLLFEKLRPRASVINVDDPKGEELYRKLKSDGLEVWGYSRNPDASLHVELRAQNLKVREVNALDDSKGGHSTALSFEVVYQSKAHSFELPVLGDFNVSNLLAVLGALLSLGYDIEKALGACAALSPAPGRMQTLHLPEAPLVVIDYAHTPDAIEKALNALKRISLASEGQLWCVMGCGGERDEGKRPVMGALTESLADQVVLTSDNPRGEDPQSIIDQIKSGFKNPKLPLTHLDRRDAIHIAISKASKNDVVLIAGKGHESYQDIKGQRYSFSDAAVALEFLSERSRTSNQGALHVH